MTIAYLPLLNLINQNPWTEQSSCSRAKDPDAWYPTTAEHLHVEPKRICKAQCPVIAHCAAEAVATKEIYGIRAGIYLSGVPGVHKQHRAALTAIAEAGGVPIIPVAVTRGANADKTHCKRGHELGEPNSAGKRTCGTCNSARSQAFHQQGKAATA